MQQWWLLIVLFGAGILTTALSVQHLGLGVAAAGIIAVGLGERRNRGVRVHVEAGFLVPRYSWRPSMAGTILDLIGLLLIAVSVWRLYMA
jgi:hypothetical protein